MKTFSFKKLSRDKVPALMRESYGSQVYLKEMDEKFYKKELFRKLLEEAHEVCESKSKEELTEELADLKEVLNSLREAHGISEAELLSIGEQKKKRLGSFRKKVYIEKVSHPEGSDGEAYCLSQPEKYPLLKEAIS